MENCKTERDFGKIRRNDWKWNPEIDSLLEFYRNKKCECGCGAYLNPSRKQIRDSKCKNKPLRVLKGHHNRLPEAKKWVVSGENHPMFGKHHTEESRKKMSETWYPKGASHPSWKGGVRKTLLFRQGWEAVRSAVLKRDNFTCQNCGKGIKEVRLDVHHWTNRPKFTNRLEANALDNLITLCSKCHTTIEYRMRKQNLTGRIAGKSILDYQQPSQEIAKRLLEGSTVRTEETIMSTSTPPAREDMT